MILKTERDWRKTRNKKLSYMKRLLLIITITALYSTFSSAGIKDSVKHVGIEVEANPGIVISMDEYQKKYMRSNKSYTAGVKINYMRLPSDSDAFAADFGYPTVSMGIRYSYNNRVKMHREQDMSWGKLEPVDYYSRLGNVLTMYGSFARPLVRNRLWEAGYTFDFGVGYTTNKYNTYDNIDNELIGSRWLIYFGTSLYATYRITDNWGIKAGVNFFHHSNGALNRPNKGANVIGPSIALCYYPYYEDLVENKSTYIPGKFKKYVYCDITLGVGAKTMNEDWQLTQFNTSPDEKDYRTDRFKLYAAYSLQADIMYRYARKWASGIGADIFYGCYSSHIKEIDSKQGFNDKHSPWSAGISAKHKVFYHNLSLAMSFGVYLYREMGHNAKEIEKPYYERIGLHYSIPALNGMTVGCNVKAHMTKADLTELVISYPITIF